MKIRFVKDIELEIVPEKEFEDVTHYNESDDFNGLNDADDFSTEIEYFEKGVKYEVDILDTDKKLKTVDLQFDDGSVAFGVPSDVFIEAGE